MTTKGLIVRCTARSVGLLLALTSSFAMASSPTHPAMQALLARTFPPDGPGAVVLVKRGDRVLHHGAVGLASLELGAPLRADSVLRIGSVAKQFAAVLLLRQVAQGKASLEDPLERYVPGFPNGDRITLEQLLNHTAGTRSYTDVPGYMETEARLARSTAELVQRMAAERPDFPPGEGWHYSNTGYILVGAVLEKLTGQAWGVQLQALFDELGMTCTDPGDRPRMVPRLASGYAADGQGWPVPPPHVDLSQAQMAGAAASCATDLLRWNEALHGGKLLPPALYDRMRTPTPVKQPADHGLGLAMTSVCGHAVLWHGGRLPGYTAMLMTVPSARLHVVVMRNSDSPEPHVEPLAKRLAAIALGAPYPELLVSPPAEPLDASLVGRYRSDSDGIERQLRWRDGRWTIQRPGYPQQVLQALNGGGWQIGGTLGRLQRDGGALLHWPDGDGEPERWVRNGDLPNEAPTLALTAEQMDALVGDYAGPQFQLRVFKDDTQGLMAQAPGQPAVPLEAQSPSRLVVKTLGATLEFDVSSGKALGVALLQGPLRLVMERR